MACVLRYAVRQAGPHKKPPSAALRMQREPFAPQVKAEKLSEKGANVHMMPVLVLVRGLKCRSPLAFCHWV